MSTLDREARIERATDALGALTCLIASAGDLEMLQTGQLAQMLDLVRDELLTALPQRMLAIAAANDMDPATSA